MSDVSENISHIAEEASHIGAYVSNVATALLPLVGIFAPAATAQARIAITLLNALSAETNNVAHGGIFNSIAHAVTANPQLAETVLQTLDLSKLVKTVSTVNVVTDSINNVVKVVNPSGTITNTSPNLTATFQSSNIFTHILAEAFNGHAKAEVPGGTPDKSYGGDS